MKGLSKWISCAFCQKGRHINDLISIITREYLMLWIKTYFKKPGAWFLPHVPLFSTDFAEPDGWCIGRIAMPMVTTRRTSKKGRTDQRGHRRGHRRRRGQRRWRTLMCSRMTTRSQGIFTPALPASHFLTFHTSFLRVTRCHFSKIAKNYQKQPKKSIKPQNV